MVLAPTSMTYVVESVNYELHQIDEHLSPILSHLKVKVDCINIEEKKQAFLHFFLFCVCI